MTGNTERNSNQVPSLTAKSNAGDNADVILWADPSTHRLLTNSSISGGSLSNNTAAPAANNIGVLPAVANAAAPSWTEGNQVLLSTDLSGALRVTGSLSVGGTTDNSAFTAGSSTGTPAMGFYHSVVDSVTDGRSAVVGITVKRAMFVSLYDASGNALLGQKTSANSVPVALASDASLAVTNAGTFAVQATLAAETTKVIGTVRLLGNAGAIVDGVITAASAPANGVMILGVYNSTEPSPTTGQSVGIQLDSKGRQRMVIMDAAGNTRGLNVDASGQIAVTIASGQTVSITANSSVNVAQINGVTPLMGAGNTGTGSPRVTLATDQAAIATWGMGATGAAVPSGANYKGLIATTANPSAATAGNLVGAMSDKLGRQVVVVGHVRDLKGNQITTITSSTAETTVVTAVASTFLDVYGCIVVNSSATAANVSFKDSTAGTTQFNIYVPAGETRGFMLPSSDAFKQGTVNNNWTATSSASVASLIISMLYVKNI